MDNIEESIRDSLKRIEAYERARPHLERALKEIAVEKPAEIPGNLDLTPREREIYKALAEGLGPREIAERLGTALKTIEAQRDTLRKKLGFAKAADLTRAAKEGTIIK